MSEIVSAAGRLTRRGIWAILDPIAGSSHSHYRRALWSPVTRETTGVALSDVFEGLEGASGWNRRSWDLLGVVAVRNGAMERLLGQPDARPAVAFELGKRLVVGELADPDGFGRLVIPGGEPGDLAHGLRLGPGDTRFAIGATLPGEGFVTPGADDVYTLGPTEIGNIQPGSRFAGINFS